MPIKTSWQHLLLYFSYKQTKNACGNGRRKWETTRKPVFKSRANKQNGCGAAIANCKSGPLTKKQQQQQQQRQQRRSYARFKTDFTFRQSSAKFVTEQQQQQQQQQKVWNLHD